MSVAGRRLWRADAASHVALADRVARTGADAVLVAGRPGSGGGSIVRRCATGSGFDVEPVLPDGFAPVPEPAQRRRRC